jgi:uncharacterized damage-inducible protein DinB
MHIAYFRTLFAYDSWARAKLLAAVEVLPEHEYFAPQPLDYGSIHGTLVHTFAAETLWFTRWHGSSPERLLDGRDIANLTALQQRWREHEPQLQEFLAASDDDRLTNAVVDYRSTTGELWRRQLWETMVHLVNHGTNHRSEVAAAISQLGHSPGDLDMIVFFNEQGGAPS